MSVIVNLAFKGLKKLSLDIFLDTEPSVVKEIFLNNNDLLSLGGILWSSFTHLQLLDLNQNDIEEIPINFYSMTSLTHLDIGNNFISDIPEEIKNLKNLSTLNISNCRFTMFPVNIFHLSQLKVLNISGLSLEQLPNDFGFHFQDLENLQLSFNRFQDFPKQILFSKKLKQLNLYYNNLREIPEEVCNLQQLEVLNLGRNQLQMFPRAVLNLKFTLKSLLLFQNLICDIPDEISALTELQELNLFDNRISQIPKSIKDCQKLTRLHLDQNIFEDIPQKLHSMAIWKEVLQKIPSKRCSNCGKQDSKQFPLHQCTGCKIFYYCDSKCQNEHSQIHKIICKKMITNK